MRLTPLCYLTLLSLLAYVAPVAADASGTASLQQIFPSDVGSNVVWAASIAFAAAALSAGWAISKAGSAGLAGSAERPEIRTTAIIIAALGEALAIYGIVIVIFILAKFPAT